MSRVKMDKINLKDFDFKRDMKAAKSPTAQMAVIENLFVQILGTFLVKIPNGLTFENKYSAVCDCIRNTRIAAHQEIIKADIPQANKSSALSMVEEIVKFAFDDITKQYLGPFLKDELIERPELPEKIDERLSMPINPPVQAALQAIFASPDQWKTDERGRSFYRYKPKSGDGIITLYFDNPPNAEQVITGVFDEVMKLDVETSDLFLITMAKIAKQPNPKDIVPITLMELATCRGRYIRQGSPAKLLNDIANKYENMAQLKITMVWPDYKAGKDKKVRFGDRLPDRLIDIVSLDYETDRQILRGYTVRVGQAMSYFLDKDNLRWVGYYSAALLKLNPVKEALTKKMGIYLILFGGIKARKNQVSLITPRTILNFCGVDLNQKGPGARIVEPFIVSLIKLKELGVSANIPELHPEQTTRGYFQKWLNQSFEWRLSDNLLSNSIKAKKLALLPSPRAIRPPKKTTGQQELFAEIPTREALQENPALIRKLRVERNLSQERFIKWAFLRINRVTLGRYESGARKLPPDLADKMIYYCQRTPPPKDD